MIQHPSWWTLEHIAWLLGTVVLLLLVILGIVFLIGRNRLRMAAINRIKAETEFSAVWNERNRMARELHDTLAQGLGAISIQLEVVKRKIPSASDARKALDEARALARSNLADARRAIWNMRSQVLETGDLAKALGDILKSLTANKKTKGLLRLSGQARRLAPITENNLLRIGQECIVNAVNHADAQTIDVHLEFAELYVKLTISDDGRGFDIEHPPTSEGGFGLSTIRERTEQMHGTLSLTSQPGKGTNVHVTVPTRI
jgi:signal transduction histidine kinase